MEGSSANTERIGANGCIKIANLRVRMVVLSKNRAKRRFGGGTGWLGGVEQ